MGDGKCDMIMVMEKIRESISPENLSEAEIQLELAAIEGVEAEIARRRAEEVDNETIDDEMIDEDFEIDDEGWAEEDERGDGWGGEEEDGWEDEEEDGWEGENDDEYEDEDEDDYWERYDRDNYGPGIRAEFMNSKREMIRLPLKPEIMERYEFLEELPDGVAVMGGVARSIAREMLTGEKEPIRDIDLVNILDENDESKVDDETLDELAKKYMADDYAFGHEIQSTDLSWYFSSRDFTINESLVMNGELIVSNFAYNDFKENIIRPTYYELKTIEHEVRSRIFIKALMMQAVIRQISGSVPLLEDFKVDKERVYEFDKALNLNKAMTRGAETAREFVNAMVDWDLVPEEYRDRPVKTAKWLRGRMRDFEFRPTDSQGTEEPQLGDQRDMAGFFAPPEMLKYQTGDRVVRAAIEEYDDGYFEDGTYEAEWMRAEPEEPPRNRAERRVGRYTADEYAEINAVPAMELF